MNVLMKQYNWVSSTREQLFRYCETLNPADYIKELGEFGGNSIRNLHVHVAECYQSWLGIFGLKKNITLVEPSSVNKVQEIRQIFNEINNLVYEFINKFEGNWDYILTGYVPWSHQEEGLTAMWLYTHTITHEFHHKGQIVSMGRQLGYIPLDTDLIAPSELKKFNIDLY
ncbi:putative damage-inducible protein DinB [Scopulibacillus daqui]|uniref:Damage-inducible protein DinB n=1 Tax=Scopulibacillus daqui TaxID=1469162 RepID=A0ABS2PZM9_9BACL|nr:DinB family protein [Scopulibacillus daqui]MBM7645398.1 putative damage-inducible protein DinB [Scopulibacillus daqui]